MRQRESERGLRETLEARKAELAAEVEAKTPPHRYTAYDALKAERLDHYRKSWRMPFRTATEEILHDGHRAAFREDLKAQLREEAKPVDAPGFMRASLREYMRAQLRKGSEPPKYYGLAFQPYPRPSEMKPEEMEPKPQTAQEIHAACMKAFEDEDLKKFISIDDGDKVYVCRLFRERAVGWILAMVAGAAAWAALACVCVLVWYLVQP